MSQIFSHGYAMVVGVGADLPVTVADATAIAGLLCDQSRCAYPTNQVKLLTSDKACRNNILSALDWLAKSAGRDDTAIVYFSGHGIQSPDYHLLPFGYNLKDLPGTAITGETFTEQLRAIQAKKLVVMLDCCHAGGQAEAKAPLPPSVIAQLGGSSGRVVLASSRRDQLSYILPGHSRSVFTEALLEALAGYGAFELDGYARILDLTMWAGYKVPQRTKDAQNPIIKVSNMEDNFELAWYAAGEKTLRPLPDLAVNASAVLSEFDVAEAKTWRRMLANYRRNLLLIEERMSQFVQLTDIPLQLVKNKRETEMRITELKLKLGLNI
ncbi:MAG: caspase family protein [Blastocatellia bacterium]